MLQSAMVDGQCTEATKACTVRISAPENGITDPGTPAIFVGASADGSVVYFLDGGKLTANASGGTGLDLYRYDLSSAMLTDLTVDHADPGGAQVAGVLGMGQSGEDIYFVASGALAAGASEAPQKEINLYAIHGEVTEFITELASGEEKDGADWIPRSRIPGGSRLTHASRVSSDGQVLLFSSSRQLTAYRNRGVTELYLHRPGEAIHCISCDPSGAPPQGTAGLQEIPPPGFAPERNYAFLTRNLSADGRRVIFDTADRLVASDENDVNDVYEWEQKGEGNCQSEAQAGGCLFLISGGTDSQPSYFADADLEGNNIFFLTRQQLVAQDKDQLVEVYDARVNGGIATQNQTPKPPCEGEACLGLGSSGQAAQTPGTSTFSGSGNASTTRSPAACVKGRTRKHGRCVKRGHAKKTHAKKHHKQKRTQRARGGSGR